MSALAKDPARFVETAIEDEVVVMRLADGDFFSMEGTARAIWRLIDGTRDRDAILAALREAYDAPADTLAAELDGFLAELREAGLIVTR